MKSTKKEKLIVSHGYKPTVPENTSTLQTVNNLGLLYADQSKLAEAEKMYIRALQGYEEALGLELVPSYSPELNTMVSFGDLFSQTDRQNVAKEMYTRALSGYTADLRQRGVLRSKVDFRHCKLRQLRPRLNIRLA